MNPERLPLRLRYPERFEEKMINDICLLETENRNQKICLLETENRNQKICLLETENKVKGNTMANAMAIAAANLEVDASLVTCRLEVVNARRFATVNGIETIDDLGTLFEATQTMDMIKIQGERNLKRKKERSLYKYI